MMFINQILPKEGVEYFNKVKEEAVSRGNSDAVSDEIAWTAVKNKLVTKQGVLVAMSDAFKAPVIYSFQMGEPETKVIMNADTEEIIMEAVLATTESNTSGHYFTDEELLMINEQINTTGSTLPDVDHEELKALVQKFGRNDELIRSELAKKKGVFKSIKSLVKDGKLWIQAQLDKRYKNHVNKFTGLSIEAFADADETKRLRNPKYLGFTFTNNPQLKSAKII